MARDKRVPVYITVSVRYGLLTGLLGFGFILLLYYTGHHPFLFPVFADFRIILLGISLFFSLKEIRDYHYKGILYFWKGMIGGAILTLCFACTASLLLFFFAKQVPSFVSDYKTFAIEKLHKMSEADITHIGLATYQEIQQLIHQTTDLSIAYRYFKQSFIISIFLTIIIAVAVRRHNSS